MIAHINGKLVEKTPTYLIIECNGLGYKVNVSLNTYEKVGNSEACKLFTEFIVREDAQLLYGFFEEEEKRLFQMLISVSGVGAATALLVLSAATPGEIQGAILESNDGWFRTIKGIGTKTAQRIIIDLKDKVTKTNLEGGFLASKDNTIKDEALSALLMLGFNKNQAMKRVDKILRENDNLSVEEVVKITLKGGWK